MVAVAQQKTLKNVPIQMLHKMRLKKNIWLVSLITQWKSAPEFERRFSLVAKGGILLRPSEGCRHCRAAAISHLNRHAAKLIELVMP